MENYFQENFNGIEDTEIQVQFFSHRGERLLTKVFNY